MAERRDTDEGTRSTHRRVGSCATVANGRLHTRRSRPAHEAFLRRCTASGLRVVEAGAIVRFTPWTCATCGARDDLEIIGSIAFCTTCLEASVREDDDDVYRDTGGGD
jgi:hypothetical protein